MEGGWSEQIWEYCLFFSLRCWSGIRSNHGSKEKILIRLKFLSRRSLFFMIEVLI